jgi:hypothetical protein
MHTARSIWIAETLVSFALMTLIFSWLSGGEAEAFFYAELATFAVSFLSARFWAGPGKVLLAGAGLAFAFATLLAIATSGSCNEGDIICFNPGEMFILGLLVGGAVYPGWAFGTGVGALARLQTRHEGKP